jgi:hypothetical protein
MKWVKEGNFYIFVNFDCNAKDIRNRNMALISATYINVEKTFST